MEEKEAAINTIMRIAQSDIFGKEIMCILGGTRISKGSPIKSLNPFFDQNGVLRVRGRLDNSELSYEQRHPIILSAKSHLVELLVRQEHLFSYHGTRSYIRNRLSDKYWVVGGLTNLLKKVTRSCATCIRWNSKIATQIMGSLPKERVKASRPFNTTGIDFAGPFQCRCVGHRSVKFYKVYAAFYVCFCTRAVHIELVSNLSTEAFLSSFQRFVSRRGIPNFVYSDNGTNFIGAQQYLALDTNEIKKYASTVQIHWKFIPPRAPNKGGLWESAVRSAKYHIVRVTNGNPLNYEEYTTLFTEIEGILNSRPLCYKPVAVDSDSRSVALTPAHFLVGSPIVAPCPIKTEGTRLSLLKRYELIQEQIRSFWLKWSKEYLHQYQQRYKWSYPSRNLQVDDVVIVKDDLAPPAVWKIGIVQQVYPDSQGYVRVADVKTSTSIKRRALNSLILLLPSEPQGSAPPDNVHA